MIYHSAIKGFKVHETQMQSFENDHIQAFVHDIESGVIPDSFRRADFIYTEMPYIKGYAVFNERANKKGKGYDILLLNVLRILSGLKKPFFIIGMKNLKFFREFHHYELEFPVHRTTTTCYTNMPGHEKESTLELLDYLFQKYDTGLDFMCGYGLTGSYAIKHKKKAILTDLNPTCIGYIYENLQ